MAPQGNESREGSEEGEGRGEALHRYIGTIPDSDQGAIGVTR
jgi:hypothetical protein